MKKLEVDSIIEYLEDSLIRIPIEAEQFREDDDISIELKRLSQSSYEIGMLKGVIDTTIMKLKFLK